MSDSSDILKTALERYDTCKDAWSEIYRKAKEDLDFLSDEPYAQWDAKEATSRTDIGRPALQIDQLTQFVHQVANDIRMNTPTIEILPIGGDADVETAEMLQGRIKAIEYKSNADSAYDLAVDFSIKSSIGFIRVDHGYVDEEGFEQEMQIKRIINPQSVLLDHESIEADGSDAKYGYIFEDIDVMEFNRLYPNATAVSFGEEEPITQEQEEEKIRIAEYFYIEEVEQEHGLMDDGKTEVYTKGKKYKDTRKMSKRIVHRCKLSGKDKLESTTFPGKYIPIVPVYGEEAWREGKRHINSLIRKSKSAQQMYNLWKSLETELLLKQQQAPVQAAVGQMRGFEKDWKNPEKAMVLYYNQTDVNGDQAPPPQRLQPPTIPTGIVNAARETVDDIRATMGMYRASVGDSREQAKSGIALKQLEKSGDTATFHFGDNLNRSITHVGKIIVCALPEIEDTPRIVQMIGKEDEIKPIGINGEMVEGQKHSYDLTKGKYDVRVATGPAFATLRQEAGQFYGELVSRMPDLMPIIGDLVFKYQDAPGAEAIASRLKKTIDPKLLDESEREEEEQNPEVMMLQQQLQQVQQEAEAQIQKLQSELQDKQGDMQIKAGELQIKGQEVEIKAGELQLKAQESSTPEVIDDGIARREMELKEYQVEQDAKNDTLKNLIEIERLKLEALKLQPVQQMQDVAGEVQGDEQRDEALQGVMLRIEELTAAIMQPITVIRDDAGNITGAT